MQGHESEGDGEGRGPAPDLDLVEYVVISVPELSSAVDVAEALKELVESEQILILDLVGVVTGPDGPTRVNGTGSPALATAGSGDVLSGACGALLAQGLDPLDAGSVGAHLHGRAGARAGC